MDRAAETSAEAVLHLPVAAGTGEPEQRLEQRKQRLQEREREADEREQRLRERAVRLRQRAVELRARADDARERAEQAVDQANAVLDVTRNCGRRAEAMINRASARAARERANVAKSARRGAWHPVYRQQDSAELADRFSALRTRTAAAAAQLAENEEEIARVHDTLASHQLANPEYVRLANEAREAARRAREIERKYGSS